MTKELKKKLNYNENKIETHICIQKMGNVFFNSQQIITNL
jgi:very-short-patch-repair endonuclease